MTEDGLRWTRASARSSLESSLGAVPNAKHAAGANTLAGSPAAAFQRRVTGSCKQARGRSPRSGPTTGSPTHSEPSIRSTWHPQMATSRCTSSSGRAPSPSTPRAGLPSCSSSTSARATRLSIRRDSQLDVQRGHQLSDDRERKRYVHLTPRQHRAQLRRQRAARGPMDLLERRDCDREPPRLPRARLLRGAGDRPLGAKLSARLTRPPGKEQPAVGIHWGWNPDRVPCGEVIGVAARYRRVIPTRPFREILRRRCRRRTWTPCGGSTTGSIETMPRP